MTIIIVCWIGLAALNTTAQEVLPGNSISGTDNESATVTDAPGEDALSILVEDAIRNNPGLKAQRARVMAAAEGPSQAGALPDPTADVQLMMLPVNGGLNASDALTKGVSIGLTQHLPFPGKLKLKKERALRQVNVARIQLAAMESKLRGEVKSASFRYVLYKRLLDINYKVQEALKAAIEGSTAVYASGKGSQTDVLLAQTALTRARADRVTLTKQLEIALARMDDLIGMPVDGALVDGVEISEPVPLPNLDKLIQGLQDTAPTVLSARAEVDVRSEEVAIAKKNFEPDFFVRGRFRHNDVTMGGHDYFTVGVGMTLPFFHRKNRYRPALLQARKTMESAGEQALNALNEAKFRVTEAYQTGVQDLNVYTLYKSGLLIQAEKAYQSALASYAVGDSDFMTLLRALTNYYNYQSQALMSKVDFHVSLARMEAVLGFSLQKTIEKEMDNLRNNKKGNDDPAVETNQRP
ncbi:MAG: TolC family protein [Acidobacteria bacterium]|nr:TolC family protein [Acidobacteriota bacterium]